MVDLPEELLLEILSWLPVELLVRFKCVCKSWYALLESPRFVTKHMVKQSTDDVILMHTAGDSCICFLSNTGSYGDDISCIVDSNLNFKCPSHGFGGCHLYIQGYCDGIVALSDFEEYVIVCNPAIREVRSLPESTAFLRFTSGQNPLDSGCSGIGFGYDPKTDDYKVIRFMTFWEDKEHRIELPNRAEVFSLRADSEWREIESFVGAQFCISDDMVQYFDGFHYWFGTAYDTQKQVLVSFDMADEVFKRAPFPDVFDSEENVTILGVLKNESIALYVWPAEGFEKCIDVWVMREFGVKESWNKQLTIGPLQELERPLVFWKNDKELLQEDRAGWLVSYDLATGDSKRLRDHHEFHAFPGWRAYLYKKTLVSVKKREHNTV